MPMPDAQRRPNRQRSECHRTPALPAECPRDDSTTHQHFWHSVRLMSLLDTDVRNGTGAHCWQDSEERGDQRNEIRHTVRFRM